MSASVTASANRAWEIGFGGPSAWEIGFAASR